MCALHVLAHVEAQEGDAQHLGELLGHLGLADAGRAGEQEAADRLLRIAQAGAGDLDRRGQALDRLVLAEDDLLELGLEAAELLAVVPLDPAGGICAMVASTVSTSGSGHPLLPAQGHGGAGLVEQVDRLVGQPAVAQVAGGQLDRAADRRLGVAHAVVRLVAVAQPFEDLDRLLDQGSLTSTFWKRRARAWSRSKVWRNSSQVVAPMQRSLPSWSAGLSRFEASMVPRPALPAPTTVWISSMKRIGLSSSSSAASTALAGSRSRRGSGCRRAARRGRGGRPRRRRNGSGTSPLAMRSASPSTRAVLPTPGSPT